MAVDVAIELETTVHAGEPVRGTVRVMPADACERVRIFVRRTTVVRSDVMVERVRKDHDEPDRTFTLEPDGSASFELPALHGPLTYIGKEIDLVWCVVAEALTRGDHVAGGAETPITLERPAVAQIERVVAGGYRDVPIETVPIEPAFGEADARSANLLLRTARFLATVGWLRGIARHPLRAIELEAEPTRVRAGESLRAVATLDVESPVVIEAVIIELINSERTISDWPPVLHSRQERVQERIQLERGKHTYEARFEIPADAAPSFKTGYFGVEWRLRVTVPVDGSTDTVGELVFTVAPF